MSGTAVRVRGIYTTALTRLLLDEALTVVQASEPIERRFETSFPTTAADATVETTTDRQGVSITGHPDAVADVCDAIGSVGIDTFVWRDPLAPGTIADGRVEQTVGGGAIVDLGLESIDGPGDGTGYLPFGAVDDRIDTGDVVRVQVESGAAPWGDSRPRLRGSIAVDAGLARLIPGSDGVTVDTRDEAAGRELVGMTELLGTTPPDGWGLQWSHAATKAGMDELSASLAVATDRAETIAGALPGSIEGGTDAAGDEPMVLVSDRAARHAWFGRESRFELDEIRRSVMTTMTGHHRIKAGTDRASAGVDFVEALCALDSEAAFPFDVVTDQFGPTTGDRVAIEHGKPDGRAFALGTGTVTEWTADGTLTIEREMTGGGTYDALGVDRAAGDIATTTVREGRWWYPTVYRSADGDLKGTYVNVCTPVECFPDAVRYIDLHVDVIKHADGRVERVDDDELDAAVTVGQLTEEIAAKARSVAGSIERALRS